MSVREQLMGAVVVHANTIVTIEETAIARIFLKKGE